MSICILYQSKEKVDAKNKTVLSWLKSCSNIFNAANVFRKKELKEENVDFLSKTNKHLLIEERKNNTMLCFAIIFGRDTKKQEKNVAFLALILPSNTTCRL